MTHLGYLLVGWGVSLGCGVIYATRLLLRGKKLSAKVPSSRQRWLTSNDESREASAAEQASAASAAKQATAAKQASAAKEASP